MRKRQRRDKPQVPAEPPQSEQTEREEEPKAEYSLDEIMDEFGGWSRPAPKASPKPPEPPPPPRPSPPPPVKEPEPAPKPEPEPAEPPPEASEQPAEPPSRFQFIRLDVSEDGKAHTIPPAPSAPVPPPPTQQGTAAGRTAGPSPSPSPAARGKTADTSGNDEPPKKKREPKDVYKSLSKRFRGLRLRMRLSFLWAVLSVLLTALCHWKIPLGGFVFPALPTGRLLIGLMFAGVFTAWDVVFGGIYCILQLRPNLDTLLLFCAVVFTVDGIALLSDGTRLPYAAVLLCALCFAMWGRVLENRAKRRSLKVILSLSGQPAAAVRSERAWGNRDCVFRAQGDTERFADDLEVPSVVDKVMAIYVPAVLGISLVCALLSCFVKQQSFWFCWAFMLAASVPLAAFITWWWPFASLAGRLAGSAKGGAALCGWRGVQELYSPCCLAATDRDLFPDGKVKINGIKIFGGRSISQLSGYVLAVIAQSGSGLTPVFQEVYLNQNGIPCRTDFFRRYEGGGLGGSIQGDQVLVGSIAFMRAMGVRMEEGTNVKRAVYCAVNNELAAVFALKYTPSPMVAAGLRTVEHARRLTLLLTTRDFLLTPEIVHRKYKIPSISMEFPSTEERARLSGPYAAHGGVQTALLGRNSFYLLAETVAGAQALCGGVRSGLAVNLLGGCIGLLAAALLCWNGSFASASAAYLMLYSLAWTLPSMVLSVASGK